MVSPLQNGLQAQQAYSTYVSPFQQKQDGQQQQVATRLPQQQDTPEQAQQAKQTQQAQQASQAIDFTPTQKSSESFSLSSATDSKPSQDGNSSRGSLLDITV